MKRFEINFYDYWNPSVKLTASIVAKNKASATGLILNQVQRTGTAVVVTKVREVK